MLVLSTGTCWHKSHFGRPSPSPSIAQTSSPYRPRSWCYIFPLRKFLGIIKVVITHLTSFRWFLDTLGPSHTFTLLFLFLPTDISSCKPEVQFCIKRYNNSPAHSAEYRLGPQSPLAPVPGPSSAGALRRPQPFLSSCEVLEKVKDFRKKLCRVDKSKWSGQKKGSLDIFTFLKTVLLSCANGLIH